VARALTPTGVSRFKSLRGYDEKNAKVFATVGITRVLKMAFDLTY
jgi:hypothetical protein